jgi:hypothetical protein
MPCEPCSITSVDSSDFCYLRFITYHHELYICHNELGSIKPRYITSTLGIPYIMYLPITAAIIRAEAV